jgi:D-alanyl-D-alanine carboxypeptidase (penicillin-binding protein 5/6)
MKGHSQSDEKIANGGDMNRICKFFIVLGCSVALTLSSSLFVSAHSASSSQSAHPSHQIAKKKPVHGRAHQSISLKKKSLSGSGKTATVINQETTARHHVRRAAAVRRSSHATVAASKVVLKKVSHRSRVSRRSTVVISRSPEAKKVLETRRAVSPQAESRSIALVGDSGAGLSRRITARSAMIMDAATGEAIYAQASDVPAQPASTIKVLTGVISLDVLSKNTLVPVSRYAAMMPKSKIFLSPGKKYPANDLINAVLLASANDASVALAEKIAGSEQAFAKMMTAKARCFGATNTMCKTANGLTASGQYTTAHDLAVIFNNAMRNSEFANKLAVPEIVNTDGKVIKSHNRALWQVAGAEGGKTGYTYVAKKTYVGKFKRGNDEIVVSLMGSETLWPDVKKLVEYGFAKKHQARASVASAPPAGESRLVVQLEKFSSHHLSRASSL